MIDRMDYTSKTLQIYKSMNLVSWLDEGLVNNVIQRLKKGFSEKPVSIC